MEIMQTNPVRGFLSILSSQVGILLLNILATPILVRLIGSANYGEYAFMLSVLGIAIIIVDAGIFDGLRKFVAEERNDDNWENNVFGFYTRVGLFLSTVGVSGILIANVTGLTARLFGDELTLYFYFLSGLLIVRQGYRITRSSLMGKGMEKLSEPLKILQKLIFIVTAISLAYFGFGVPGLLIGHIAATLTVALIGFYYVFKKYDLQSLFRRPPDSFPRRELLFFNSGSVLLTFLMASMYHIDILLLQPLAGSTSTGHYKAALMVSEFLWFIPNTTQTALLHSTSEIWSSSGNSRVSELSSRVTRYTLVFSILLIMGLAALADPLLPIYYGPEFTASILPLLLLLPGTLGFAVARPIFAVGQGKGDLRPIIIATGAAAVVNLLLNLFLIPLYGPAGAAVATSVGYGSMLGLHGVAAKRIGYNPFIDLRIARIALTVVISAPIIFGGSHLLGDRAISLFVIPPLGFLVYSFIALRLRAIDPDEILPLINQIPSPASEYLTKMVEAVS